MSGNNREVVLDVEVEELPLVGAEVLVEVHLQGQGDHRRERVLSGLRQRVRVQHPPLRLPQGDGAGGEWLDVTVHQGQGLVVGAGLALGGTSFGPTLFATHDETMVDGSGDTPPLHEHDDDI